MPLIPALERQRQVDLYIEFRRPGLHRETLSPERQREREREREKEREYELLSDFHQGLELTSGTTIIAVRNAFLSPKSLSLC